MEGALNTLQLAWLSGYSLSSSVETLTFFYLYNFGVWITDSNIPSIPNISCITCIWNILYLSVFLRLSFILFFVIFSLPSKLKAQHSL